MAGWKRKRGIPKGFRLKAQGCEERASLGTHRRTVNNPNGVVPLCVALYSQLYRSLFAEQRSQFAVQTHPLHYVIRLQATTPSELMSTRGQYPG
jgi:hypothetical protein